MEPTEDIHLSSSRKRPMQSLEGPDPSHKPNETTVVLKVDDIVLAIQADDLWHKAKIKNIDENFASIVYLSSGETEQIHVSSWATRLSGRCVPYVSKTITFAFHDLDHGGVH